MTSHEGESSGKENDAKLESKVKPLPTQMQSRFLDPTGHEQAGGWHLQVPDEVASIVEAWAPLLGPRHFQSLFPESLWLGKKWGVGGRPMLSPWECPCDREGEAGAPGACRRVGLRPAGQAQASPGSSGAPEGRRPVTAGGSGSRKWACHWAGAEEGALAQSFAAPGGELSSHAKGIQEP